MRCTASIPCCAPRPCVQRMVPASGCTHIHWIPSLSPSNRPPPDPTPPHPPPCRAAHAADAPAAHAQPRLPQLRPVGPHARAGHPAGRRGGQAAGGHARQGLRGHRRRAHCAAGGARAGVRSWVAGDGWVGARGMPIAQQVGDWTRTLNPKPLSPPRPPGTCAEAGPAQRLRPAGGHPGAPG